MKHSKRYKAKRLLNRLIAKDSTLHERLLFARWLAQMDLSGEKVFNSALEERAMETRMREQLTEINLNDDTRRKPRPVIRWAALAATIMFIAGLSLWWNASRTPQPTPEPTFAVLRTGFNEQKKIKLPDGSLVTLNASSELKVLQPFLGLERQVKLDGEAYFDIAPDTTRRFTVSSGNINIHVLGTSFNVRHYVGDAEHEVVVASGKVQVSKLASTDSAPWILLPGNKLVHDNSVDSTFVADVDASDYAAWRHGQLVFNDVMLTDICKRLERRYQVNIYIRDEHLKKQRLSIKQKQESLQQVMEMLGKAGGFSFRIQDRQVTIMK